MMVQDQNTPADMPITFAFVIDNDKSQIRSHAMKESWRQRGRVNSRGAVSKGNQGASGHGKMSQSSRQTRLFDEPSGSDSENSSDALIFPSDGVFLNLKHTLDLPDCGSSSGNWKVSAITSQEPQIYQLVGKYQLDPFNTIMLSREDQALLHHCEPVFLTLKWF
jgi:hypothetical protein